MLHYFSVKLSTDTRINIVLGYFLKLPAILIKNKLVHGYYSEW